MSQSKATSFYGRSLTFTALSLMGAGLNYVLYPVLARILSVSAFGDYTTIVAASNQILGILLAFNVVSIYLVKHHDGEVARKQTQVIQKILIWLLIVIGAVVLCLSPLLATWLKIAEPLSFLFLILILMVSIPATIWTGYLQGHKELVRVGLFSFLTSFFKLVAVLSLGLALGQLGSLGGVLIGSILGLFVLKFSRGAEVPNLSSLFKPLTTQDKKAIHSLRLYIAESILVVGSLNVLQNFDITAAKSLFSGYDAGLYSGVSILSNTLYYVAFLIVWIVLPELDVKNPGHNQTLLKKSLFLLASGTALVLAVTPFIEGLLIKLWLGERFLVVGNTLIFAILYQLTLVMATFFAYYLLVTKNPRALLWSFSLLLPTISIVWLTSYNILSMIVTLWLSLLCGAALYCIIITVMKVLKWQTNS